VSQVATIKTGTGRLLEFTQLGKDVTQNGGSRTGLRFGPFTHDQQPVGRLELRKVRVHYETAAMLATFGWAEREVTVSQWGVVAFEEHYQLRNDGSRLRTGFSRLDMQQRGWRGNSFQRLAAELPPGARAVQLKDVLGNISSSHLRVNPASKSVLLEASQRFPVFGGWKTEFYQTYEVPTTPQPPSGLLWVDAGTGEYVLRVPAGVPYRDPVVDELTLRIVLPEGAEVTGTALPQDMGFARLADSKRVTWLDTELVGRPVIVFQARHLVAGHTGTAEVRYTLPPGFMLREPMMLVSAFVCLFAMFMAASRTTCGVPHSQ
jgi:oligosaccharyltransferase complex subunit alpha (ribophorin I)